MASAPLFRFKQGDHCCVFYEDESALLDLVVPYLAEGLQKRERCFTAQTKSLAAGIRDGLKRRGVAVEAEIARGALTIATIDEFYGMSSFDSHKLIATLKEFIAESVRLGYTGCRTAGEMQFAIHNGVQCEHLLEYERLVNEAFPGRPVHGLCQYNTRLFDAALLEQVIAVHQQCMTSGPAEARHSSMAIRRGRYILDIVTDRRDPSRQFYYVVQEHGYRDILAWGVERCFDDAIWQGESLLNSLQTLEPSAGSN